MNTGVRESTPQIHANRLIAEKSPYLLKHAYNPVDWYPWGQEAFDKARREGKPIFLSVGYSTCRWCEVMQHESFQSEAIGEIMNKYFVCIKLDREERPDVDKVYSTFLQETSSNVGWPMNVWLTPELRPYFGGNFFPLHDDGVGTIGFRTILMRIADQWETKPFEFVKKSETIFANLQTVSYRHPASRVPPFLDVVIRCYQQLHNIYDEKYGGFSEVSKYPTPVYMRFLLTFGTFKRSRPEGVGALQMALHTLKTMSYGGIRDHVGSGFHRNSTDKSWHVPRFEKMLYDQAQLAVVYALAYQISGDELFAEVSREILDYVSRELSDKNGGFYSTEDAYSYPTAKSSEKKEGAFYVWTADEIQNLLPDPVPQSKNGSTMADIFMFFYGVTEEGNTNQVKNQTGDLEGKNVLIQRHSLEMTAAIFHLDLADLKPILQTCKERLLQARKQRPKPFLDTKMLASWNGLMITAFAKCGMIFSKKEYINMAENAKTFLYNYMFDDYRGHLLRSCYLGGGNKVEQKSTPISGVLEDYAFVINALFDLYEATLDQQCLEWALRLQEKQDQLFWDSKTYGYFTSSDPFIILRVKDDHDGAQPNSNSISVSNLLRAAAYTRNPNYRSKVEKIFASFSETLLKLPFTLPEMARALTLYYKTLKQVVIAGKQDAKDTLELLKVVYTNYVPNKVLIYNDESRTGFLAEHLPFLSSLKKIEGRATAYVYEKYSWSKPVTSPKDLYRLLVL